MNQRNKKSLKLRLIGVLSFAAFLIWGISTAIAWFEAKKEVNEMFDAQQILFAKRLVNSDLQYILSAQVGGFNHQTHTKMAEYDDDALAFAVFTQEGELLLSDDAMGNHFIFEKKSGFHTAVPRGDDDPWRIFWLPSEDGNLIVAVGQEWDYRDDLVEDMVFGQMWVWLVGLPLLLGLMVVLIHQELKSLNQVARQMESRSPEDHQPLDSHNIPSEIQPLVQGLNNFFNRTSQRLARERRFTSDAAHELRSPLAGLRMQAELAQMFDDDPDLRYQALRNLTQGIDRATQVIEQLLTLSRLDNLTELDNVEPIHWQELIQQLMAERYQIAAVRQIELQFVLQAEPPIRQGQPILLSLMLRNVLDNAIHYTPEGSQVRFTLTQHQLVIEDNGGGVAEEELAKLGQRFYRPAGQNEKGSGLGLSIVRRIAELHQIQVRWENVKNSQQQIIGLRVIFSL